MNSAEDNTSKSLVVACTHTHTHTHMCSLESVYAATASCHPVYMPHRSVALRYRDVGMG
jgi:hypothetical protein